MLIGIDASRANIAYRTGTEWYSFYLIKYLAEIDKENTYCLYCDKELRPELEEIVIAHNNFSVKVLHWPFGHFWTLGRLSLEMLLKKQPDVLFVPAHSLPFFRPKKTITTIHDIAFRREGEVYEKPVASEPGNKPKAWILWILKNYNWLKNGRHDYSYSDYLNWSTRYALKHAQKIIAVSNFTKQEIIEVYKTNPKKITVIHNGFNDKLYHQLDNQSVIDKVLEKYGLLNQKFILTIGRLERKKNIATLIEAFAIFRENNPEIKEKLLLIGSAGYGYDEIRYAIEEYNLGDQVLLLGWVEENDLPAIHNAASAFVFPTRHEGFGIPVLQALACGLPTAVSDLPVLHEVAGNSVLYFDKDDRRDMAAKMKLLLSDTNLRESLKAKGIERTKEFSWQKCAVETLETLSEF